VLSDKPTVTSMVLLLALLLAMSLRVLAPLC
jgi:hypothetical protein